MDPAFITLKIAIAATVKIVKLRAKRKRKVKTRP